MRTLPSSPTVANVVSFGLNEISFTPLSWAISCVEICYLSMFQRVTEESREAVAIV